MTEFTTAYFEGLAAADESTLANPYAIGTVESRAWLRGREDAKKVQAYEDGRFAREAGCTASSQPKEYGKEWLQGYKGTRKPEVFCRQLQRNAEASVLS